MDFPLQVNSPVWFHAAAVPDGTLVIRSMEATEVISQPFEYRLELVSPSNQVDLTKLLGEPATITLHTDATDRSFHGIVTEFELAEAAADGATYRAVLRPWLWLLTRTGNCRIFQEKTIPDIIKTVFREHGFSDFLEDLCEEYDSKDYVVQYCETDFHFVSRLMEQEGIHYYFVHTKEQHTLVLADTMSSHEKSYSSLRYYPHDPQREAIEEYVHAWTVRKQICSGAYATTDYDFESPAAMLQQKRPMHENHPHADFEVYEYPGGYTEPPLGKRYAQLRAERFQAPFEVAIGYTNARRLEVGRTFTLTNHPTEAQNREYLVLSAIYNLSAHELRSRGGGSCPYHCQFTAMDNARIYRPPTHTKKPRVRGPQTAVVAGKKGEEIWTDKYGRVLVKFHWDRESKGDENSSCWIRVSQGWANTQWGMIHIPRIGEEVIVDFLEGDPDRPIITGRVYNGINTVPYDLPQNQTQSGIKSRSTKDGKAENFNEIRFEDKKGHEELYIQAEKTQTTLVKGSQSITVKGSRSKSVGGDESNTINGTRTTTVEKKDTVKLNNEHDITVKLKVTQTYQNAHDISVTNLHTGKYDGKRDVTVTGGDKLVVNGGNRETTVHGQYDITADTHWKLVQGGNAVLVENAIKGTTASGPITFSNGSASVSLEGGKISITANDEIALSCGASSLTMKKDGSIQIKGAQKISAGSGSSTLTLEPAGVNVSGTKIGSSAIGIHEISGALVKIN